MEPFPLLMIISFLCGLFLGVVVGVKMILSAQSHRSERMYRM